MDFDLTSEQLMLQEGVRRFVRERTSIAARRSIDEGDGATATLWAHFAELGWLSMSIPEAAGGMGATDVDLALVMEELGRGAIVAPFVDTVIIGQTLIQASDDAALRDRLSSAIADGSCRMALAHTEADGRSEFETPVATRASADESGWRLSGVKRCVVHGAAATHWLATARTESGALSLFVVDAVADASPSIYPLIDGSRACDLQLNRMPATLLPMCDLEATLELALDRAIVALSAAAVGSMEAVMLLCAEHLKQRVQFGQPLSKFQALQHRMAEMFIETDQARSMLYQGLAALESDDSDRRRKAASGTKVIVARAGHFVTGQGIQLHGGIGITEEYPIAHHYKSMLVFDKRLGDATFHLNRSAGLATGPR